MQMVLIKDAVVRGRAMKAGEEFDCPEKEARLWAALARAKSSDGSLAPAESRRPRRVYNRRDMRAEG